MIKILNEIAIHTLVNETLTNIICEGLRDSMKFGISGHIPAKSANELIKEIPQQVLDRIDSGNRDITPSQMDAIFGNTTVYRIYSQYKTAMESKKDSLGRTAISFWFFLNRLRNGFKGAPMIFYEVDGNFMIGCSRMGVFLCVYFAPKGSIGMFRLIKEMCQYDNVVFSVTDDIAAMLEKLGVPKFGNKVKCKFRGQVHEKEIYGSTPQAAAIGAKIVGMTNLSPDKVLSGDQDTMKFLKDNPEVVQELMNDPRIKMALQNGTALQTILSSPIGKNLISSLIKH